MWVEPGSMIGARLRQRGFGLTEMLVVLFLAAMVLAVAVPLTLKTVRSNRRNGAARQVLAEIRLAQSMSATRGSVHAWQWGPDAGRPNRQSRVVRDAGECDLPEPGAPQDGTEVVRTWSDLARDYRGVTIESVRDGQDRPLGSVMFDALGAAVNPCVGEVSFPIRVTLADGSGVTRVIVVRSAGGTSLQ